VAQCFVDGVCVSTVHAKDLGITVLPKKPIDPTSPTSLTFADAALGTLNLQIEVQLCKRDPIGQGMFLPRGGLERCEVWRSGEVSIR
jgi:hypothetical protein